MTNKKYVEPNNTMSKEEMLAKLEHAEAEGNDNFTHVLGELAKDKGVTQIALSTGLDKTNLYRSLRQGAKPRYETIRKVLQRLGISIKFE